MPFSCIVGIILGFYTLTLHAILPNSLVFTPYASFPIQKITELGYQLSFHSIQGESFDKGVFINHSLSKRIQYGIEFFEKQQSQIIIHHFAYKFGRFFNNTNYNIDLAGSLNYLSNQSIQLSNQTLYQGALSATWLPLNSPVQFHATAAKKIHSNQIFGMFAISFNQHWGLLAIEYNSKTINLSSQFDIYKKLIFRGGLTKNTDDSSEIVFKTSFGVIDFIDFNSEKPTTSISNTASATTTETATGLNHIQEGLTFFYAGEYRKALKSYKIAAEFFPHSAMVKERLGSIYFKLGEFKKAQDEWEKANIIAPSTRLEGFIQEAKMKGESIF